MTTHTYGLVETRKKLFALVRLAAQGHTIVLTAHGFPVVKIVGLRGEEKRSAAQTSRAEADEQNARRRWESGINIRIPQPDGTWTDGNGEPAPPPNYLHPVAPVPSQAGPVPDVALPDVALPDIRTDAGFAAYVAQQERAFKDI